MTFIDLKKHLWLAAIFIVVLPLFCWLQWQPRVWFDNQLAANGLAGKISYADVGKSFPGFQLSGARIALPDGKTIAFDEILLRPAIFSLLSGTPALFIRANAEGMDAESVINLNNDALNLSDVAIIADTSKLARFDSRLLLLGLQGEMSLNGDMRLQADNGLPLDGVMKLVWNNPSSILLPAGPESIRLEINIAEAEGANMWNWQLSSEPEGMGGKGKVTATSADIQQWLLRGNIRLAKDQPDMVLSGTLGAPHWQ